MSDKTSNSLAVTVPSSSASNPSLTRTPKSGSGKALRKWQREALHEYVELLRNGQRAALWEATPGAGKTTAALKLCRHQMRNGLAKSVIVVVPTAHLKHQWAHSAKSLGIDLDSAFRSTAQRVSPDYHGIAVTYQQVANSPEKFARFAQNAVVVLDEVHHAGDGLSWGDGLTTAFEQCRFLLALSGTPFRSDNNPIPFVRYCNDGLSEPDYVYSHGQAVKDGVCRPIVFLTYGGSVSWSTGALDVSANFADELDRDNAANRLRAALDPDSHWIDRIILDANNMLKDLRREQSDAGGLIVCRDQDHARKIAQTVKRISGYTPVVVLSDDRRASKKIADFRASTEPWIIACNMVSEGVDIPRLRVGVFATVIQTKMYFRQFLGRIVRSSNSRKKDEIAYCYIPADPVLTHHAEAIDEEQRHSLTRNVDEEDERPERKDTVTEERAFVAFEGVNTGVDKMILDGNQLAFWEGANQSEQVTPFEEGTESIQKIQESLTGEELTKSERKAQLAREVQRLVGLYRRHTGLEHAQIHFQLNRRQSVKSQSECTENQLMQRICYLNRKLAEPILKAVG